MCIALATRGELRVISGQERVSGIAVLIGPNTKRSLSAENAGLYSLNLDPTHRICRYLRTHVLRGRSLADLSNSVETATMALARKAVEFPHQCADVYRASEEILHSLFPFAIGTQPMDDRIDLVTSWLWSHVPVRVDLGFLSTLSGLSKSRLAHLFTAEVGVSLRQYLLWVKMRKAAEMFVNDAPLADVAHEIGFSDSAHLSRTFMRYFALKPSFLSNPKLVRVQICDGAVPPRA